MSTRCEILVVDDEPIVGERLKAFIEKTATRWKPSSIRRRPSSVWKQKTLIL